MIGQRPKTFEIDFLNANDELKLNGEMLLLMETILQKNIRELK